MKALLALHSPFLHQQPLVKLWLCLRRDVGKGVEKRVLAGVHPWQDDAAVQEERGITQNLAMVPGRRGKAARSATAAMGLQGVPKKPHHSWVSAMGTVYETGMVRDCCRVPRPCGCR